MLEETNNKTMVSYGGGTNSTALIIECINRHIDIDLILFADTGGEKPHTYKYILKFNKWLDQFGLNITRVQTQDINGTYITLEQKCREQKQLPSIAYGFKSCSEKHKIRPQNKFMNNWQPAIDVWKDGFKIDKLVGFDAGEDYRAKNYSDNKYNVLYPLVEWEFDREDCVKIIQDTDLGLPGKSACFFCPSSKASEIKQLAKVYPDLMDRAMDMEKDASLDRIKGLGRNYAWSDLVKTDDMFEDDFLLSPEISCDCYDG